MQPKKQQLSNQQAEDRQANTHVMAGIVAAALMALFSGSTAWAQVPSVDPSGAAPEPAPAPQPAPAPEPVIIQVPVQGQAGEAGQAGQADESGYYYTDDLDVPAAGGLGDDPGSDPGGVFGPVPAYHVVRRGDTLWDICWLYFNNPWEWPKVWSYNPKITNPHWIYPGDLVRLYPEGLGPPSGPGTLPSQPEEPGDVDVLQPTPARRHGVGLRQLAFVDPRELDFNGTIVGSVEEKSLLSRGDSVYLDYKGAPPKVGARYAVYTETQAVTHPDNGKKVGAYVKLLGEVEVQSVKKGKRPRAVITDSVDVIERGDRVGPVQRTFRTVEPQRNEVDVQGTVVAIIGNDQLIGQGQVIFVDKGSDQGIKVGNRMYVVRRGDAYEEVMAPGHNVGKDDRRFPARAIGELIIAETGRDISVALVTLSLQEIGIGDMVLMRKARE